MVSGSACRSTVSLLSGISWSVRRDGLPPPRSGAQALRGGLRGIRSRRRGGAAPPRRRRVDVRGGGGEECGRPLACGGALARRVGCREGCGDRKTVATEGAAMLVKTYYSTGHFDVFDTATLTDSSLFKGNVLTDYALEVADARSGRALWLDLFYYEAADDGCATPARPADTRRVPMSAWRRCNAERR